MGIDMASSETPDLIFLDLSLPVIDGSAATMTIKTNEAIEAGGDDYDTQSVDFPGFIG
jgi:CheY-like chemotaxis protein